MRFSGRESATEREGRVGKKNIEIERGRIYIERDREIILCFLKRERVKRGTV